MRMNCTRSYAKQNKFWKKNSLKFWIKCYALEYTACILNAWWQENTLGYIPTMSVCVDPFWPSGNDLLIFSTSLPLFSFQNPDTGVQPKNLIIRTCHYFDSWSSSCEQSHVALTFRNIKTQNHQRDHMEETSLPCTAPIRGLWRSQHKLMGNFSLAVMKKLQCQAFWLFQVIRQAKVKFNMHNHITGEVIFNFLTILYW